MALKAGQDERGHLGTKAIKVQWALRVIMEHQGRMAVQVEKVLLDLQGIRESQEQEVVMDDPAEWEDQEGKEIPGHLEPLDILGLLVHLGQLVFKDNKEIQGHQVKRVSVEQWDQLG